MANIICSTIIPTIGRSSLTRAVNSVLSQDINQDEFEVIVVNDSGKPLAAEYWMKSPRVIILHTNQQNRSVARNTGAGIAQGKYFHFLDDDDWILPGMFQQLQKRTKIEAETGWVYGGFRLVNNDGEMIKEFHPTEAGNCFIHMMASEWIPLQASWIASDAFFAVGGFAPLHSLGGGYEDIDLARLIARHYEFTRVPETVAVIRYGDTGSTTDYKNLVKQNRLSREKSLESPGAFRRMWESTPSSGEVSNYWHGQIIYYYLVSFVWNVKQKNLLKATNHLFLAFLAFVLSFRYVFSSDFWRGVIYPHHNLVRVTLEAEKKHLFTRTVWER